MTDANQCRTLGALVGANVRRLRHEKGLTADQVAARARVVGLLWTRSAIASLENGGRLIDAGELPLLGLALQVGVSDLLAGDDDEMVRLTKGAAMRLAVLRDVYAGRNIDHVNMGDDLETADTLARMVLLEGQPGLSGEWPRRYRLWPGLSLAGAIDAERAAAGLAEKRAAHKLGVDSVTVSFAAFGMWGRSLTEERDARAGPGASQAARGRITRHLLLELEHRLEEV